jgi:Ca2+-binding RTX toxin-like protein
MPIINGTPQRDVIDLSNDSRFGLEVWAAGGDDTVFGSPQADLLIGGTGEDHLQGNDGDDTLYGWTEDDWLFGGRGNDTLSGGDGADGLLGGRGNDTMDGGAGNDGFNGGLGRDTMTGGSGVDTYYFTDDDIYTVQYSGGPFRWTRERCDTDVITDFDTSGADADKLDVHEITKYHSNYVNGFDSANTAADAISRGYVYWIESGSGATLKTTVYVDPNAGAHHSGLPFFGEHKDFALVELQGVAASQLDASHFIV